MKDRADAQQPRGALEERMLKRLAQVPLEIRRLAQEAVLALGDRPMARDMDEALTIRKLALLIHENQFTDEQVSRAAEALDRSEKFRPGFPKWREQLEKEAAKDATERSKRRKILKVIEGGPAPDQPGTAQDMPGGENQLTEEQQADIRARMRAVLEKGLR